LHGDACLPNILLDDYRDKFLDAYGRDKFDIDRYRLCVALQAFTFFD
jgi:aminoglycoside phosphotransferase